MSSCRATNAKAEIVWVKLPKTTETPRAGDAMPKLAFGMGRYLRNSHEICIVASRGRGLARIMSHSERSVFFAPVGRHSEKPDEFYELVERLAEGPRLELFARRQRPTWTCLGDELGTRLETAAE